MGYTTDFEGYVTIDPPLNEHEVSFLRDFCNTRRMNRRNGPLFVGGTGMAGQDHDADILDYNNPHPDQPGLWCQWVPTGDGTTLGWDGGGNFYHAAEWMKYLVENLLAPSARFYLDKHASEDERLAHFTADHTVNGEIFAQGEDSDDRWVLVVEDNVVKTAQAQVSYTDARPI